MSIYKCYKHGGEIELMVSIYGLMRTFKSLRKHLGRNVIRIKHKRIQIFDPFNNIWSYKT